MTPSLRAALTLPAAALALLGPLAAPSSAISSCEAVAGPPHLVYGSSGIHAEGAFACATASSRLTVTVCIQERYIALNDGWRDIACAPTDATNASAVVGAVTADAMIYSTTLRTTVTGVTAEGAGASATSAPVVWVNCACMP